MLDYNTNMEKPKNLINEGINDGSSRAQEHFLKIKFCSPHEYKYPFPLLMANILINVPVS